MFEYKFNDEYRIMLWRQAVEVNIAFMLELIEKLHEIEQTHPPFHRFVDLSDVTGITLHCEGLQRIADMRMAYTGPKVKSAFYSDQPLGYGIARMYEALMGPTHVEVRSFNDLLKRADWPGCPVELLKP